MDTEMEVDPLDFSGSTSQANHPPNSGQSAEEYVELRSSARTLSFSPNHSKVSGHDIGLPRRRSDFPSNQRIRNGAGSPLSARARSSTYFLHEPLDMEFMTESMTDGIYVVSHTPQRQIKRAFATHDNVYLVFYKTESNGGYEQINGLFRGYARVETAPAPASAQNPRPKWYQGNWKNSQPFRLHWHATQPVGFWNHPQLLRELTNPRYPLRQALSFPFTRIEEQGGENLVRWLDKVAIDPNANPTEGSQSSGTFVLAIR
ncbi:hypothetical protein BT63DRAFT_475010 [Microthyrium microscopicum]|uniref:YTH domain-containing protein n=1 Tax=Microthyrium microscopicum TaxID=703497 RepID=A0A6A6UV87_9PEZI|nr:hypothetical protein BT63DRAFT_475010 [Microthyrium microscopicum]